jgi:hypothetical protein
VLDSWLSCQTRDASSVGLPLMWPGRRNNSAYPHLLFVYLAGLEKFFFRSCVCSSATYLCNQFLSGGLCSCAVRGLPKEMHKGLNSLIILVNWEIWKHRNTIVFEGARLNIQTLRLTVAHESSLWCFGGASALHELLISSLVPDPWGWLEVGWLWSFLCPLALRVYL